MLLPLACGSGKGRHAAPTKDAGLDAPPADATPFEGGPDALPESSAPFAPAPHDPAPQVVSAGGPVLQHPVVVPVFFPNDSDQPAIEQFLASLPKSSYWGDTTSEYGVGPVSVAPSIVTTLTLPATASGSDVDQLVSQLVSQANAPDAGSGGTGGASSDGGVPDGAAGDSGVPDGAGGASGDSGGDAAAPAPPPIADAIYVLFLPASVTIDDAGLGQSCVNFGGYHAETYSAVVGADAAYAVIPRCPTQGSLSGMDALTVATSHELVEAATDPHPFGNPAYDRLDHAHAVWAYFPNSELGDMCDQEPQNYAPLVGNDLVQLIWSNTAAAAGHDPCVPNNTPAYFNAVPDQPDNLVIMQGGLSTNTRGVKIAVGQTRTIDVHLFSDAPRGPWLVQAQEADSNMGGPSTLSLSVNPSFGNNGDILKLTITRKAPGPIGGGSEFMLSSRDSATYATNLWFGYVGN